jgi:hypothetical protein
MRDEDESVADEAQDGYRTASEPKNLSTEHKRASRLRHEAHALREEAARLEKRASDPDFIDIEDRFKSHVVDMSGNEAMGVVRSECRMLAYTIIEQCPPSRERSLALTFVQQAMWAANSAISYRRKEVHNG